MSEAGERVAASLKGKRTGSYAAGEVVPANGALT